MTDLSPVLIRRLAAYAATAGVVLALPAADAQIVYHDYEPDRSPPDGAGIPLDVDIDGATDYLLEEWSRYYYPWMCTEEGWRFRGVNQNHLMKYIGYSLSRTNHLWQFQSGSIIGPVSRYYDFYWTDVARGGSLVGDYNGCVNGRGLFINQEGYAGFRFDPGDGQYRYGWMRIRDVNASDATVLSYAYESAPGVPIAAGALSDALLDGNVNQTSFPPTGGALVYAFTVENTTDEPQPLALWVDADGPATFTRLLGSGTLPAGATVTRMMRVQVPAGAPSGGYDVKFMLGDFASGHYITFERYAITKEAGGNAAEGAEPFAATRFEDDLFAVDGTASTIVSTHALDAPSPNPSHGRTTLALTVAEPQRVAVTVYDALGREVAVLHDGPLAAGEAHRLSFDGSTLPVGVYVVRAVGETFSDTRVLTLRR